MAIQRSNSPSEADSYERATAFLSDWIEDSLHVPNASSAKVPTTAAAHLQHHSHHFHDSMPDLPTGSLRRRRSTFTAGDAIGDSPNDGAINSLVHSLRASLVLNNQQQSSNNNNHGPPNNSNNGRGGGPSVTVKISPSCVRGLSSTNGGGGNSGDVVIDNIPPLPFAAGGRQGTVRSDPTAFRRRTSSSGAPPAPSSTVRSDPSSSGRGRRRSDPSASGRGHRKGGGEPSKNTKQHHSSSSSSKRHSKKSSSRNHYDYSRRHSLDCERSLASGSASCGPPRSSGEGEGESCSSGIYYGGRVRSRTPNNERHVHWPDHSSRRQQESSSSNNNIDPPPTMVVSLPWTDHLGNVGHYTGQVNQLIQPHGSGALSYDNGQVTVKGIWNNGNPSATSTTSRKSSSPSTSPVVEKEVVAPRSSGATTNKSSSYRPKSNGNSNNKSSSSRRKSKTPPPTTEESTTTEESGLSRLKDLHGVPSFDLGDVLPSPKYQIIESNPARALNLVNQLHIHDFAWILRSSREWTYSIVADFPTERGEDASIRFVIDKQGNTKTLKVKHWAKCVRLVNYKSK